jgi:hypothetical protein
MFNFIQIKRRVKGTNLLGGVPTLSSGELAYNENSNELYYGHTDGTVTIAGSGSYLKLDGTQTVSGNKTFTGATTLSSITLSPSSTVDLGNNRLTNLAAPQLSSDAATMQYVDDVASGASSSNGALSAEIYNTFVKLTEERPVTLLSSINISSNASVGGNLTVSGDLTVLGELTQMNTNVTTTSAFSITNAGSQTALTVTQTGAQDVAVFTDAESGTALIVKDGGNVGVGTATPNEKLTVVGNISATGNVIAVNGDLTGTLEVDGASTLRGAISAQNVLTVDGATTLKNTLAVDGASTFASSVSAQGALTIDGTSTLNGAVTVDDTLSVAQATTLSSTLSAVGSATFGSTVTVTGVTTLNNALSINANTTTTGNITGSGSSLLVDFVIDGGTF